MLQDLGWTDIGNCPHLCQGEQAAPTCNVRAAVDATRRDFILVNKEMLDAIQGFGVMEEDTYPTHPPIQVSISVKKLRAEQRLLRKPTSAAEAFDERIAGKVEGK